MSSKMRCGQGSRLRARRAGKEEGARSSAERSQGKHGRGSGGIGEAPGDLDARDAGVDRGTIARVGRERTRDRRRTWWKDARVSRVPNWRRVKASDATAPTRWRRETTSDRQIMTGARVTEPPQHSSRRLIGGTSEGRQKVQKTARYLLSNRAGGIVRRTGTPRRAFARRDDFRTSSPDFLRRRTLAIMMATAATTTPGAAHRVAALSGKRAIARKPIGAARVATRARAAPAGVVAAGKTMYDKIVQDHVVDKQEDGTLLLYIDRHMVHEVTSPQAFEVRPLGRFPRRRRNISPPRVPPSPPSLTRTPSPSRHADPSLVAFLSPGTSHRRTHRPPPRLHARDRGPQRPHLRSLRLRHG